MHLLKEKTLTNYKFVDFTQTAFFLIKLKKESKIERKTEVWKQENKLKVEGKSHPSLIKMLYMHTLEYVYSHRKFRNSAHQPILTNISKNGTVYESGVFLRDIFAFLFYTYSALNTLLL
jgi:hypothetical protein